MHPMNYHIIMFVVSLIIFSACSKSEQDVTEVQTIEARNVLANEVNSLNEKINQNEKYRLTQEELELLKNEKLLDEEEKKELTVLLNK